MRGRKAASICSTWKRGHLAFCGSDNVPLWSCSGMTVGALVFVLKHDHRVASTDADVRDTVYDHQEHTKAQLCPDSSY